MERYGGGPIVVRDYDPEWPEAFERERVALADVLGPLVTAIEHVGSTAVPGLAAKPIIDLLVGVRSLADVRSGAVQPLHSLGYAYVPEYAAWLPGELFFRKAVHGPWTHHAHVMEPANPRWRDLLLFRDHLRRDPDVARAYGELKKRLARKFGEDIAAFREAKGPFVQDVLARARSGEVDSPADRS